MQHHQKVLAIVAILAWSGFLLDHPYFSESDNASDPFTITSLFDQEQQQQHRSLRIDLDQETDAKSINTRSLVAGDGIVDNGVRYVVEGGEAQLTEMKNVAPTVDQRTLNETKREVVIDVLSIGSETRVEYLTGQVETWATDPSIRHFWGFTEEQDYDACPLMSDQTLNSYASTCKSPKGWDPKVESFVNSHYGKASGLIRTNAGWFCAQRRPGRALGWLQAKYGAGSATSIPDILLIVDDDASVDIEKVKQNVLRNQRTWPYSSAGCTFRQMGITFAFGGFGTFVNKAALERMTQPIFCNEDNPSKNEPLMQAICANLARNRVGELNVFQQGDTVLDIFYKYSGQEYFCMHSDWALGYMLTYYSGGPLNLVQGRNCRRDPCTRESVSCHNQTPRDMEKFMAKRSVAKFMVKTE